MATNIQDLIEKERQRRQSEGGDDIQSMIQRERQRRQAGRPAEQQAGAFRGLLSGVNTGLGDVAGAVGSGVNALADLTGRGLEAIGAREPIREFEQSLGIESVRLPGVQNVRQAQESIGTRIPEDQLSREGEIASVAGEVIGGSIPFAAAPLAAVNAGATGGRFLRPVLELARRAPGRFTAAEAGGVSGAAQGAAAAEAIDPGNVPLRTAAEIGGGFFTPVAAAGRALRGPLKSAKDTFQSFSRAGRENRAAEILQDVIQTTGENPEVLARRLNQAEEFDVGNLTAGQKTGSPALRAVEKKLAERSPQFSGDQEQRFLEANRRLERLTDQLTASGNPQDLAAAAALRQRRFDNLLSNRVQQAEQEAASAFAKVGRTDRGQASERAFNALDDALKDARTIERSLFEKIPQNAEIRPDNLRETVGQVRQRLLDEEALPFSQSIARIIDQDVTTTGDLLKLRNRALERARDARASGNFREASTLDQIAQGALDDIESLELPSVQQAREFSRQLNDKFTRSFGGQALARSRTGGRRNSPELLLQRAFSGGGQRAEQQFRELEEAAGFPSGIFDDVVRNEQEAFLRDAASEVIENGQINPQRLQRFRQQNQRLLARFPELQDDLANVESAQRTFQRVQQSSEQLSRNVAEKAAFARVADVEDPARQVGRILTSDSPVRGIRSLARTAKRAGDPAVQGLKTSAFDFARNAARNSQGQFSFRRFRQELFEPRGRNRPAVVDLLRRENVVDKGEANRLKRLVDRAIEVEDAVQSPGRLDELIDEPDGIFDLAVRVAGANIGGASSVGQASGTPIVAAQAGSRFLRRQFEKIPQTRTLDVLTEAARDPQFTARLLKKARTPKQRRELERQVNSFLLQTGLVPNDSDSTQAASNGRDR